MASADRLIEIFNEAKTRPDGAERDLFLSEACRDEPELKEQVLSLLQAHAGAGDFLKNTQVITPATLLTEKPGDRIGRYKLLQEIGEGGCGVVYMAEQLEPVRRRVALKVIKLGMDTKQVVARFEAEGQALALMDHPNIAKVFDAGATDTGRPYFVMELVRGIKITDYCDQNNLLTEARLKLFTQVCHAIQHAHQKGIIHRDIKPSNILVTDNDGVPVPKVIDFGIAKAIEQRLTDKTVFTAFEQFIGTPAYMSPEQAEMTSLDIDTRADIYSLGVLLYELLSGNTPFDAEKLVASGVAEIRRIIREQEPPKPSMRLNTLNDADLSTVAQRRQTDPPKLMQRIRGDLDWIVMKCLEKDRTRRYETANGLATDIRRHLQNEPVVARPPSNLYRFQKLVRRHKLAFAAASAVIAAVVIGLGLSTWMFFKEKQARQRAVAAEQEQSRLRRNAEAEVAESRRVAKFLGTLAEGLRAEQNLTNSESAYRESLTMWKRLPGNEHPAVASLLQQLSELLSAQGKTMELESLLQEQPGAETSATESAQLVFGHLLWQLGHAYSQRNQFKEAERVYDKALQKYKQLQVQFPTNLYYRQEQAFSHRLLGQALSELGRIDEAVHHFRVAIDLYAVLAADAPENTFYGQERAYTTASLAGLLERAGRSDAAAVEYRQTTALYEEAIAKYPDNAAFKSGFIEVLRGQGKLVEVETLCRQVIALQKKHFADIHRDVDVALFSLALVLQQENKLAEAEAVWRETLVIRRKQLGHEHPDLRHVFHFLTGVLCDQGKFDEAEAAVREELALTRKLGNEHPQVSHAIQHLAAVLGDEGKYAEARTAYQEAAKHADASVLNDIAWTLATDFEPKLRDGASAVTFAEKAVAGTIRKDPILLDTLAAAYAETGQFTNAVGVQQEAIALLQDETQKKDYSSRRVLFKSGLPYRDDNALAHRVRILLIQGKFTEAEPLARECLALREKQIPDDWLASNARSLLGGSLVGQTKYAEAEPLLLSGYEGMKQRQDKIPAASKRYVKETLQRLVQLYEATGQSEKAAEWNKKLAEFDKAEAVKRTASPKP